MVNWLNSKLVNQVKEKVKNNKEIKKSMNCATSSTSSTRIVNWLIGEMVELGERENER